MGYDILCGDRSPLSAKEANIKIKYSSLLFFYVGKGYFQGCYIGELGPFNRPRI